jgi:hypothetical protein
MAKTLKDFLNERQLGPMVVKNPDEQKFIDKHVVAKVADRNGNDDELFKGSKVKMADRKKEGHGYNPGEDEEVYEELKGNQHKIDANKNGKVDAQDFKLLRKKKKVAEEAEQIDELSTATLQSYRKKARAQGNDIVDKMKVGGGDWSKDQKDTKTLRKRSAGAQMSGKTLRKRGESLKTEEAEQIDEISKKTLGSYLKKATADGAGRPGMPFHDRAKGRGLAARKLHGGKGMVAPARVPANEEAEQIDELSHDTLRSYRMKAKSIADHGDDPFYREKGRALAGRKSYGGRMAGIEKAKVMAKEEAEQIDELSKATLRSYAQNAKDQMSRSDTVAGREMGARAAGAKPSARERMHNRRADKRHAGLGLAIDKLAREEVEIEEKLDMKKASMGTVVKDFQKSDAPQFKGKSQKKRQVMAIAAKLSAERGGKPLNKEERLLANLGDLAESHKRTLLNVFSKLNEDNQRKFMATCETPEGIEQMLNFAIQNRGE